MIIQKEEADYRRLDLVADHFGLSIYTALRAYNRPSYIHFYLYK